MSTIAAMGSFSKREWTTRAGSGTLIPSDKFVLEQDHGPGPATFWMIGGTNTFEGNVAAGSEWFGFMWEMDGISLLDNYHQNPTCGPEGGGRFGFGDYIHQPFGSIRDLIAHSTMNSGIWLRHTYTKPAMFNNIQVYKAGESGFFLEVSNGTVQDFIFSDTRIGVWSTWPSTFKNGTVVGTSDLGSKELGFHDFAPYKPSKNGIHQLGQFIYDGPSSLYNVHFENFTTADIAPDGGLTCHLVMNGGGAVSSKNR